MLEVAGLVADAVLKSREFPVRSASGCEVGHGEIDIEARAMALARGEGRTTTDGEVREVEERSKDRFGGER